MVNIHIKIKDYLHDNWLLLVIVVVLAVLLFKEFSQTSKALLIGAKSFASIVIVLAPIFILVGLFEAWVDEEQIIKYLGGRGFKSLFFGAILGTVYSGPLLGLFPILKSLVKKGARPAVAITTISTFAIKIPMIPLEIKFLGITFTILHNLLILVLAPFMSIIIEKLLMLTKPEE